MKKQHVPGFETAALVPRTSHKTSDLGIFCFHMHSLCVDGSLEEQGRAHFKNYIPPVDWPLAASNYETSDGQHSPATLLSTKHNKNLRSQRRQHPTLQRTCIVHIILLRHILQG